MYKFQKHFSIDEARALLPVLRIGLDEMIQLIKTLKGVGFDVYSARYKPGFHPDTQDVYPAEFRRLIKLMQSINQQGIEIKSIEDGLIDFPALRPSGEEVYLCWKLDEDDIVAWHTLDGGFSGRQGLMTF